MQKKDFNIFVLCLYVFVCDIVLCIFGRLTLFGCLESGTKALLLMFSLSGNPSKIKRNLKKWKHKNHLQLVKQLLRIKTRLVIKNKIQIHQIQQRVIPILLQTHHLSHQTQ